MKKGCSLLVALAMLMCAVFSGAVAEEDFDPVQLMHDVTARTLSCLRRCASRNMTAFG